MSDVELARYGTCLKRDYVATSENEKRLIEEIPQLIGHKKNKYVKKSAC